MNPETQSIKFDPQGKYIKRWIPELEACPEAEIHMPSNPEQYNYPKPMVDLERIAKRKQLMYSLQSKVKINYGNQSILYSRRVCYS